MSTLRVAHLQADLAPKLTESECVNGDVLHALSQWHVERVHELLNADVFTNRTRLHNPPLAVAREDAQALTVVEQSRLTAVGNEVGVLSESAVFEQLRFHRRLDAAEIMQALCGIEREMRLRFARLMGTDFRTDDVDELLTALEQQGPSHKRVIASDMDGVLAVLKTGDPHHAGPVSFRDTRLGFAVQKNAAALEEQLLALTGETAEADAQDTEVGLLPYFVRKYGAQMEKRWGEEAKRRIRDIYLDAYQDPAFALAEAEKHIAGMPLAYHVFRHKTWDHRIAEVYDMDTRGGDFAAEIVERGGKLLFVTAAPRIHALKMLKSSGVTDAVPHDAFELYAMEDMYEPGTVEDGTYVEGDKGALLEVWAERNGVDKSEIAMGGDQYTSDVEPVMLRGMDARVVRGPEGLERYANSVRLPRDERAAKSHS